MPDILICDMKMPDSCEFCRFHGYGGYGFERVVCSLTGRNKEKPIFSRFDDCPLHELPPHGDLIDVSKVVLEYGGLAKISPYDFVGIAKYFAEQLEGQPVIVPASEEVET